MRVNRWLASGAIVVSLCLAGCGGGGGGGGVPVVGGGTGSTPPPSPSPSPSPSPTATAGARTGVLQPQAGAVALAAAMELTRTPSATSQRSFDPAPVLTIRADGAGGYQLSNALRTRSFDAAQLFEDVSAPDQFPHVGYQIAAGGSLDYLLLAKPPNASPPVVTIHGGYGAWQHNDPAAGATRVRLDYFTYGAATPVAAMPRTGRVTYRVPGTGNYASDAALSFAYHDTFLTVDFAAGIVTANLGLSGTGDFLNGGFGGVNAGRIEGTIVGNGAAGELKSTVAVARGRFALVFYGPNAEELGLVYSGGFDRETWVAAGVGIRYAGS